MLRRLLIFCLVSSLALISVNGDSSFLLAMQDADAVSKPTDKTKTASIETASIETASIETASIETASIETADEKTDAEKAAKEQARLLERYHLANRVPLELRGKQYKPAPTEGKSLLVLDTLEYGLVYDGTPNGSRYLVGRLHLLNLTDQPVSFKPDDVKLNADGETIPQSEIVEKISGQSFPIGRNKNRSFSEIKRPDVLEVPPHSTAWMWVFFYQLEFGPSFPEADLEVTISGQPRTLNLKHQALGQLDLKTRRIGPEGSLALFEISGRLNLITLSVLSEEFDRLVDQHVKRLVLTWSKNAQEVDSNLSNYLYQYALRAGRETNRSNNQQFPILTNGLREIHLAAVKGQSYSSSSQRTVMHEDVESAIATALWSILEILPREELLAQIEQGDPLVRAAALSAGAPRLAPDRLDLVLSYLDDPKPDEKLALAAVYALRHFGTPQAIEKLIAVARDQESKLSDPAIASLTQSRFQTARAALDQLVAEATGDERQRLLKRMTANPAPAWAELYFENVRNPASEIRVESLQALDQIGHDRLLSLLRTLLHDEDEKLRDAAFEIMMRRREPELESLLEELVLARLAEAPPDGNLQNYLRTTKNARAVPLLIEHLKAVKKDHSKSRSLIQLLGTIGDDRVADLFLEIYPDLPEHEQANVLNSLGQMQVPAFLELAQQALKTKHSSLVYAAINNLTMTDSRRAEEILIAGFEELEHKSYFDNLANAISQIGSERAEEVLRSARKSEVPEKRRAAINAYRYLLQRKPSYQYIHQANYQLRNKNWEEALNYVEMAVEIDDKFAPAHAALGSVLLRLKKVDRAEKAFARALSLDPETGEAVVGQARVLLRKGKVPEALKQVESQQTDFAEDNLFQHHTALFYAEVHAWGKQQENPSAELKAQIAEWEYRTLRNLSDSVKNGFSDRQLIQNAPEFEPFAKHADFEQALRGRFPEREQPEPDAIDADPKSTQIQRPGKIIQTGGVVELLPPSP